MSKIQWLGCTAAMALSLSPASLMAQATPPAAAPPAAAPAAAAPAAAAAEVPARDPQAMAALNRMGVAMRGLQNFGLHLDTTSEQVLASGQKIQTGGTSEYRVVRPNAFRVENTSAATSRSIIYDGTTLTLFSPRIGYYATFPAPGDIRSTIEQARDRLGLEIPISDLFNWGADTEVMNRVTDAITVGSERIDGQACTHYAMRQEDVDWQIWIREGELALPCKIVITATDDTSMPQFTAVFSWLLNQSYGPDSFTFTPPEGARRINFTQSQPAN